MILTVTPFSLPSQPPLHRVRGNLALDFANTVSWRATDRETDHIASPEGLARWAVDNGLIDAGKAHFPDDALATAHALRTAIRTVIEAAITQQNRPQAAAVILDVFKECLASARFEGSPARILFHASPADILGPIALAAVDLLRGDMFARLRMCPQDDCHWLFLDMTKNKSRRWCDMASCGNRAKASQFRKRHAVGQNPGQGG